MNIKKSSIVLSSIVISFIAVTSLSSNVTPAYSEESSFSVPKAVNSRMSSALDNLIYKKTAAGALKTGVISGMPARTTNLEQKKTRVILETRDNDVDLKEITSRGGEIVAERRGLVAVEMPLDKIEDVVNNVAGIEYARLPRKFFRCGVTSEGVSLTLASNLHSAGFTGQGVKIAIIDLGFNGLSAAQANGDLPYSAITRDYTGTGLTTKYKHGTACAEIVYDMAPGAELHLLKVSDEADIYNALDYCIASGIEIISASIGTYGTGPGNGTGSFDEVCDEARLAGILIVSAAGNDGNTYSIDGYPIGTHWEGVFIDSNYNNIHEFLPGYEYNVVAGFPVQDEEGGSLDDDVEVMMRWDDWPNAATDYDMYLYDYSTSALVASSTDIQNGSQPPIECMSVNLPDTDPGHAYKLKVTKKISSSAGKKLEIFVGRGSCFIPVDLSQSSSKLAATSSGSICEPADAASVCAVGAIRYTDWTTGPQENFSSQGPTNAWAGSSARTKPDICGPDGVSGYTYGSQAFYGTSAATPHVAGAAALILSMHPYLTVSQLQSVLESNAVGMGSAGKDNLYGNGRLKVLVYNSAPVLDPIGNKTVNENSALSFSLNASDPDGDSITYTTSNLPAGSTFDLGTRTFRWTPTYSQAGSYSNVRFQVSDGKNVDYEEITITVVNVNRPPFLNAIGNKAISENSELTFIISATDPDGGSLSYSASNLPQGASFDPVTRKFTWIPAYDQAGSYANIRFQVSDGEKIAFELIVITVNDTIIPDASRDLNGDGKDDLVIDFGPQYGIWIKYGSGAWSQLHTIGSESITTNDLDGDGKADIIIDFGNEYGIWIHYSNGSWVQLHNISAKTITAADIDGDGKGDIVIDFGDPYGIWTRYSNGSWAQLHNVSSKSIASGDIDGDGKSEVIVDFGAAYGIWIHYSNGSWAQLHNISAKTITAGDIDGDGKSEVIVDFGAAYGIWIHYSNGSWVQLHNLSAKTITAANIDGNGKADLIINFGDPHGIWVRNDDGSWWQLHNVSP